MRVQIAPIIDPNEFRVEAAHPSQQILEANDPNFRSCIGEHVLISCDRLGIYRRSLSTWSPAYGHVIWNIDGMEAILDFYPLVNEVQVTIILGGGRAINFNFVIFSVYLDDIAGYVFVSFILTIAAAESAIGLDILTVYLKKIII